MAPLEQLGFALAGYGCTTCIGNSGPLDEPVAEAIEKNELVTAAVLSGNRNFEGRIHPLARASYLASPPLVVAFALAGRVDIDLTKEPLGIDDDGRPVFLADIWPSPDEIRSVIRDSIDPELFRRTYASVFDGDERWQALPIPAGDRYDWDPRLDLRRAAAVLRGPDDVARAADGHRRRPRAGGPRRLGHDRPHLAGRLDRALVARRPVAPAARRQPARVQLVRRAARPPRGPDARHLRQHPAAQRARVRGRGAVHASTCPTARRASSSTSRAATGRRACRSSSSPARSTAPGSSRDWAAKGPLLLGVRAVDRRDVRADPPHEPRGDGHPAAPVPARREPRRRSGSPAARRTRSAGVETLGPRSRLRSWRASDEGRETDVRGHLPDRRPDRARLLPQRRHPAGGPAADRAGERAAGSRPELARRGRRATPARRAAPGARAPASRSARARRSAGATVTTNSVSWTPKAAPRAPPSDRADRADAHVDEPERAARRDRGSDPACAR